MQIQPIQPVEVNLRCGELRASGLLVELTEVEIQLKSEDYLERGSQVVFASKFFRGEGTILDLNFSHPSFYYRLQIIFISFQPGLVVNQKL